jgi:hypothetical protein
MRCHIPKSIPGTFKSRLSLAVLILWAAASFTAPASVRAQAPDFGPNVKILDPSMSAADIQSTLDSVNAEAQFSTNRYQVFFMPGTYSPQAQVGYYEAVAGLGQSPSMSFCKC